MSFDRDTEEGFAELRAMYEKLLPTQRLKIARDRLLHPDSIPNRLVLAVSATEGLARVLLRARPTREEEAEGVGPFPPRMGVPQLVDATLQRYGKNRRDVFQEPTWQAFVLAVRLRNFLVHEAGYVNQVHGGRLLAAVEQVFRYLESLISGGGAA